MRAGLWELLQTYPRWAAVWIPTFLVSFGLTGLLYRLAMAKQLLPAIRERDVHTTRKPRIGGVAMWLAIVVVFLILAGNTSSAFLVDFGNSKIAGVDRALWGILAGMTVLLVAGILDDLHDFSWKVILGSQFLAALCLVVFGIGVPYVRLPGDFSINLTSWVIHLPAWLGGVNIAVWSAIFTLVWTMTIINVMNFFDGLDGLAGSVAFTAALILLLLSLNFGYIATATVAVVFSAAVGGFLPWNWYPSKIIMGTVGSQILGFLLGVIAIISGGKLATAVLVLGVPFLDAVVVIIRRLVAGQSPFKADQRHLHHRLLKIGLSVPSVVLLINAVAVVFGALALHVQRSTGKGVLTLILAACMGALIYFTYVLERRAARRVH